ncbi:S-adenosyl-L-methionine-dependent methyltransferase [Morchella snyderi]|nr:S-adenosyl-L-methionine-dependent methyltransferase [Morchella snyderi]
MADASTSGPELVVDQDYVNQSDSDYNSSFVTDTTSLKSSILDYIYENGRRYHRYKEGSYMLPNDETEQDRLDMHHHIFGLLLGGALHLAPIGENPQNILDVGTGTGIWAIEMADLHPSAKVTGIDLSPIQPKWVPPNCTFEVDDAEMPWTYPADHFDLIHSRNLMQSIRSWPKYLEEMYKHTRPGGWIDVAELEGGIQTDDDSIPEKSFLATIMRLYGEALETSGLPQHVGRAMKKMVEEAGFVDVQLHVKKQPLGGWPKNPGLKKVGQYLQICCETGFEAYSMALFTRVLGMTSEEVMRLVAGSINDIRDRKIHSYINFFHVVGKRPE